MRDYKKRVLKTLLVLGAFLKDYKKHAWKPLLVLGVVLFVGIPKAHAFWPLLIIGVGALAALFTWGRNLLGDIAVGVIKGLCWIIDLVVNLIGHVLFWIANTTIDWAMKFNSLISESSVVKDGFSVFLSVANLGLLAGFVVMAIAIMIRADWLVEVRKAIPKFIAAALLVNFGFFILTALLIEPVNGIFQNVYRAAKINISTFSGAFMPNLDFKALSTAQLNLANIPEGNRLFAEKYLSYLKLKEDRIIPTIAALLKHYETGGQLDEPARAYIPQDYNLDGAAHFPISPVIGYENYLDVDGEVQRGPIFVTPQQRTAVAWAIMDSFEVFLGNMNNSPYPSTDDDGGKSSTDFWSEQDPDPDLDLGSVFSKPSVFQKDGASYKQCDLPKCEQDRQLLKDKITSVIQEEFAKEYDAIKAAAEPDLNDWGFGCQFWDEYQAPIFHTDEYVAACAGPNEVDPSGLVATSSWNPVDYTDPSLARIVDKTREGPTDLEEIVILLTDTLFNATFIFLGSFTLLGVGLMLIYRYVVLSLLIIVFPFVWLGWIFPKIAAVSGKNIWSAWWGQFLRWLIFGPVAMFFVYLAAHAAVNLENLSQDPNVAYVGKGSMTLIAASVGNMAVIIGLLVGGTYVANKMGIAGSGMIMGTIKSTGKRLEKAALKYTGKTIGGAIAGTGRAALRSKTAQNTLGKLQGLAGNRNRLLRTVAAPLTGTAAKLKEAGQRGGRKAVDEHMDRFKDMRSEDIVKMYSSLRTEEQRMAAYKTVMQRGDYNKMANSAMKKDFARWSDDIEREKDGKTAKTRVKKDARGNIVRDANGNVVMEEVKRRTEFEKYNQEEVLKKAKKQFFDGNMLRLLEDLDIASAKHTGIADPATRAQAIKNDTEIQQIRNDLKGEIKKRLSELSGQEAQIFVKNTSGLLGDYKLEPEKHTAGVGDHGGMVAHELAGEILGESYQEERPEVLRGAQRYMSSSIRGKLIKQARKVAAEYCNELADMLTQVGMGRPLTLVDASKPEGVPITRAGRNKLIQETAKAIGFARTNGSQAGMTPTDHQELLDKMDAATTRLQSVLSSGLEDSMFAFADASTSGGTP